MEEFIFLPSFHNQNQVRPLQNVHVDLSTPVRTHIHTMLKRNFQGSFISRVVNQCTKASTFHFKIWAKFLFKEILTRRAAAHVPSTNNEYILHTSIK